MATVDPPWRLDPFQNIVNVNWSALWLIAYFTVKQPLDDCKAIFSNNVLGFATIFDIGAPDAFVGFPTTPSPNDLSNTINTAMSGLQFWSSPWSKPTDWKSFGVELVDGYVAFNLGAIRAQPGIGSIFSFNLTFTGTWGDNFGCILTTLTKNTRLKSISRSPSPGFELTVDAGPPQQGVIVLGVNPDLEPSPPIFEDWTETATLQTRNDVSFYEDETPSILADIRQINVAAKATGTGFWRNTGVPCDVVAGPDPLAFAYGESPYCSATAPAGNPFGGGPIRYSGADFDPETNHIWVWVSTSVEEEQTVTYTVTVNFDTLQITTDKIS